MGEVVKIGLTGGIGTGKTYISKYFKEIGIPVFHADEEAKKLYSDPAFARELKERFPDSVTLDESGGVDVGRLKTAFSDKAFLRELSEFVHPYVHMRFEQWAAAQWTPSVIMESAVLFEYGIDKKFDRVIVAHAPLEIRIRRVEARNPELGRDEIMRRIDSQMPQEDKCALADLVIMTGETFGMCGGFTGQES